MAAQTKFKSSDAQKITAKTAKFSSEHLRKNPYYCSIACHHGQGGNFRDDLESTFYVLCKLLGGGLPWENIGKSGEALDDT